MSMWPWYVKLLNVPPELRRSMAATLVMAIIPAGPDGKEPEELLADELLVEQHIFKDCAGAPQSL